MYKKIWCETIDSLPTPWEQRVPAQRHEKKAKHHLSVQQLQALFQSQVSEINKYLTILQYTKQCSTNIKSVHVLSGNVRNTWTDT